MYFFKDLDQLVKKQVVEKEGNYEYNFIIFITE